MHFYYIPYALTVYFPILRSVKYQPIFHTLYFTLHRARVLNNIVLTTVIEMVEILNGRVRSIQWSDKVLINNLLHLQCFQLEMPITCFSRKTISIRS